ncbi:MAG TPA: transposase family protein, partial [Candidatus Cloacimonadota bacterium]|nr:transposase family protein [Candidatus Cloacimonadota bacterium]
MKPWATDASPFDFTQEEWQTSYDELKRTPATIEKIGKLHDYNYQAVQVSGGTATAGTEVDAGTESCATTSCATTSCATVDVFTAVGREVLPVDTELELRDMGLANVPVILPMSLELPPKQDALAKLRAGMLLELENYKKGSGLKTGQAKEQFLSLYNKGLICEDLFKLDGAISLRTLFRREQEYKLANRDYRVLAPAYAPSKGTSALREDVDKIVALLFTDRALTIGDVINKWKWEKYIKHGKTAPVSDRTMRRAVEREIDKNKAAWDLRQKGEKWFSEHRLPTLLQDLGAFKFHEQWQTDGKLINVMVINPFTGKPQRAHICAFIDVYSTMPVGLSFDWTENSAMIQEAYLNGINFTKVVPETIKQDNGSGFVSASTLGEKELLELQGIYYRSGVKDVSMHRPYNAKGKSTIERTFGTFTSQFEAFLRSYVGRSVAGKPASMQRNEKWVRKLEDRQPLTAQEFKQSLESYILGQYASQKHPRIKGKSRAEVYGEAHAKLPESRFVKSESFVYLLRSAVRTVDNNGINIRGALYYSFELVDYVGQQVKVRYGMMEDRYVLVYTLD